MNKCCNTCRNYNDGKCYSDAFVESEEVNLPEVYIKLDKEEVISGLKENGYELFDKTIIEVVDLCKYHADYEFEDGAFEKDIRPQIADPSDFYCKDYC